jgi:hypothetical protein
MLVLALGLGLTAVLVVNLARWRDSRPPDLGAMSNQWVAAYNSSPHASSS